MRSRNLFRAAPVGVALVFGMAFGATPASAGYTDCQYEWACMWTANNYPGNPNASFKFNVKLKDSNNKINSIANNGKSSIARFYDADSAIGKFICLNNPSRGKQWRDPDLSNGTDITKVNWSNRISYAKFV